MRADIIAGRGRIGNASALGAASWRLSRVGEYVYVSLRREVVRLTSGIIRAIRLESGI